MNIFDEIIINLNKVETLLINELEVFSKKNEDLFLSQQKDQLWDGQTSEEKPIEPTHKDNKYFKTTAAAEKYIKWKESFTKNPKRDPNTPNLFITGKFYSELSVAADDKGITFDGNGIMSRKIIPIFKNILGLTDTNLEKIKIKTLPLMIDKTRDKILER